MNVRNEVEHGGYEEEGSVLCKLVQGMHIYNFFWSDAQLKLLLFLLK